MSRSTAVAAFIILAFTVPATATGHCEQMASQLASLRAEAGVSPAAARARLQNAQVRAQRAGCLGGFLFFRPAPGPQCAGILAELRQAETAVARTQGGFFGFRRDPRQEIAALEAAMAAQGCNAPRRPAGESGGLRTVCVRTCDGFYFPVSYSTGRSNLERDGEACQARCPGTRAELYYHPTNGDMASARTVDGRAYSELPTAFRFREEYQPSCSCAPEGGWATIAARIRAAAPPAPPPVPVPLPKPSRTDDPETFANMRGQFVIEPVEPADQQVAASEPPVRLIGPGFFYAE